MRRIEKARKFVPFAQSFAAHALSPSKDDWYKDVDVVGGYVGELVSASAQDFCSGEWKIVQIEINVALLDDNQHDSKMFVLCFLFVPS